MTDSVRLGEPLQFYLTARYPSERQLLFPDSTFSFAPFEFQKKKFFATRTANNQSYDSAVYTLSSFEIEPAQTLKLPAFILLGADCTAYYTDTDTVFFKNMVKKGDVPDSLAANQLPLKTDTAYRAVSWMLNYPLLLIIAGVLLILAIVLWAVFGERIRKHFAVKRLARTHQAFVDRFEQSLSRLAQQFSPEQAEQTALLWKAYMERLTEVPFTKYTTRELKEVYAGDEITSSLTSIDRMVYGQIKPDSLVSFEQLKAEAEVSYKKRIAQTERDLAGPHGKTVSQQDTASRQYSYSDVVNYANLLRGLPCPICGSTAQPLNGSTAHTVTSLIFFTWSRKKPRIACPTCLTRKNNLAILHTVLLGWWGFPWGLIKTPQYLYLNIKARKQIKSEQPSDILLALTAQHITEIDPNQDNQERLKQIIKPKKSWWQY